jgi:hypothetical protein
MFARYFPISYFRNSTSGLLTATLLVTTVLLSLLVSVRAQAQRRVDLEDMNIKGELLNDNRLRMSSRDPHKITDRVHYRTDFRKEITDGLEVNWPDKSSISNGVSK